MNRPNAIVIVVDRLGAGFLAPYGNTWVETPAFNKLASQAMLHEFALATSPTVAGSLQAIARGTHPWTPEDATAPSLFDALAQAQVHTALLTDEPWIAQLPIVQTLAERMVHEPEGGLAAAESLEQTQLAASFAAALDWLGRAPQPFCLLFHTRGLGGAWDAPQAYRERFADEEDPPVPVFVEPPRRSLGQDVDPDEIWGIMQAYAGQVAVLDVCLDLLLEWLEEHPLRDNTLLIVTSPRGYPLGEHGHLGERGDGLYEEVLHVPLLIRVPDQQFAMHRSQQLTEHADLHATLAEWFQVPLAPGSHGFSLLQPLTTPPRRDCIVSTLDPLRSIRTPGWFLRQSEDSPTELYAKPDDHWEVNEVAARCGTIADELTERLAEYERLAREQPLSTFPPLPEHLIRRTD